MTEENRDLSANNTLKTNNIAKAAPSSPGLNLVKEFKKQLANNSDAMSSEKSLNRSSGKAIDDKSEGVHLMKIAPKPPSIEITRTESQTDVKPNNLGSDNGKDFSIFCFYSICV